MTQFLWHVWFFLLGLAIGSFLNVVIYRLPRKIGFVRGRSFCPQCRQAIRFYENIPLVSFLFLRGRCSRCGARISVRYPIVELLNGLCYLYFFSKFGFATETAAYAILGSLLIAIFFIDMEFQLIPDLLTLPGMALGIAFSLAPGGMGIIDSLLGLLAGGGVLYLIALLGDWLFKKESMGGGDIKMAAMLGAFLGWQKVILIFFGGAVIGLLVSVVIMVFSGRLRRERVIPFGPFLALAAAVTVVYGDFLIAFYMRMLLPA